MSNAKVAPCMKGQDHTVCSPLPGVLEPRSGSPAIPGLNRVMAFVDANLGLDLCVPTLATVAGMSPYHFCRVFKQSTGITPHRYVLYRRMEQAKRLLQQKSPHLMAIAHAVGFADQSQFTRVFHKMVGTTPSHYRKTQQPEKLSN